MHGIRSARWRRKTHEPPPKRHRWERNTGHKRQCVTLEQKATQQESATFQSSESSLQKEPAGLEHPLNSRPVSADASSPQEITDECDEENLEADQLDNSNSFFEENYYDDMDDFFYDGLHQDEDFDFLDQDGAPSEHKRDSSIHADKPLYDSAPITVEECLLAVMTYAVRHKITGKALTDLLKLIKLLCPQQLNTDRLSSIHHFRDFFSSYATLPRVMHKYCTKCMVSVEEDWRVCLSCKACLVGEGAVSSFIEVSIEAQLKMLFAQKGFQEKLNFRFSRQKKMSDNMEDIYVGYVYRKHVVADGPLSDPKNISFMWNTDGVPIFKSSKFSVWPFYCIINKLSFVERNKRENMIFAGLWFGDSKPSMLTFLEPLSQTLQRLQEHGVLVRFAGPSEPFLCKVFTIAGTCDLPAKAMVYNTVQFNGQFGCLKCEQPGVTVKTGMRGHVHAFPYQQGDPKGPLRTHDMLLSNAKAAYESQNSVRGVKGPTWLSKVKNFDLIDGNAIDYMHCVLLGVMRVLMVLWFSSEFSRQPFSMAKDATEIDKRLKDIQPPSTLSRCPRAVTSHRMFFKASEYRSILQFFGRVVFRGILGALYYNHFLLLSEAVFILLMESVSSKQIDHAEKLLWNFCSQISNLYGERYQTANMHLLVHLADSVRALGPLWTHSCFHFDDKNGYLLRLIHGTQNIHMQLVNAVGVVQSLPSIAQTVNPKNAIAEFYSRMSNDRFPETSSGKTNVIAASAFQLEVDNLVVLEGCLGQPVQNSIVKAFKRAQVNGVQLTSRHYTKDHKRNNFTVVYNNGTQMKYGQVEFYFICEGTNMSFALVNEFENADMCLLQDSVTNGTCFHIIPLLETPARMVAISLQCVLGKVVFLNVSSMPGLVFVGHLPNVLERD